MLPAPCGSTSGAHHESKAGMKAMHSPPILRARGWVAVACSCPPLQYATRCCCPKLLPEAARCNSIKLDVARAF